MRLAWLLAAAASVALAGCWRQPPGDPETTEPESPPEPGWLPETGCRDFELRGEVAVDKRTGLQWDRHVWLTRMTRDQADTYCASRGGRLPTPPEVLALRTEGPEQGCLLSACAFGGDRCATIQSGTQIPGVDARWGVAFSGGALVMVPDGAAESVLCVR